MPAQAALETLLRLWKLPSKHKGTPQPASSRYYAMCCFFLRSGSRCVSYYIFLKSSADDRTQ